MKRQLSEGNADSLFPPLLALADLSCPVNTTASNDPSSLKKPKPTSLVLRLDQTAATGTGSSGEDSATPSLGGAAALTANQKKKIVLKEPTAAVEKSHKTRGMSLSLLPSSQFTFGDPLLNLELAFVKGPVDVDKHCGVINDKGFPCSRSLTCKTHSMGAKRSVPHRSQPYDLLLAEWNRATKPTSSVPGIVGGGSGVVEQGVHGGGGGLGGEGKEMEGKKKEKKKKKGSTVLGGEGLSMGGKERRVRGGEGGKKGLIIVGEWSDSEDPLHGAGDGGELDSEEEVEAVLRGLGRISQAGAGGVAPWGRPLAGVVQGGGAGFSASSMFVGRNVKLARLREALGGLFGAH